MPLLLQGQEVPEFQGYSGTIIASPPFLANYSTQVDEFITAVNDLPASFPTGGSTNANCLALGKHTPILQRFINCQYAFSSASEGKRRRCRVVGVPFQWQFNISAACRLGSDGFESPLERGCHIQIRPHWRSHNRPDRSLFSQVCRSVHDERHPVQHNSVRTLSTASILVLHVLLVLSLCKRGYLTISLNGTWSIQPIIRGSLLTAIP